MGIQEESMSERKLQIQVGAISLLSLLVLIAGILWFKDVSFRSRNVRLAVEFVKTSGLTRGDPVEVSGVPSGQVAKITYKEGRALVLLDVNREVTLYPTAQIVIENVGIMGQKLVAVYPGDGGTPLRLEGATFQGSYQSGIPELMTDLGGTLAAFDRLARRLDGVLAAFSESDKGSLARTLYNTEQATGDLVVFLRESRGELVGAVRNFSAAMQDLHEVLEGREGRLAAAIEATTRTAQNIDSTLTTVRGAAARVDAVLARIEAGEGTLGRISQEDTLYVELVGALRETRVLMQDIQANPKKYVKLSLF
jgi:phospholipid/cholesterol/gamma-HCH transport system substrate-binding protein